MKTTHTDRFSPLIFKNGKTSSNRIVIPPMASGTADIKGYVTEKTLEHYSTLSKSGAGLILVEYSFIHESGRSEENQLGISSDANINGLKKLAQMIKASGALPGIQLTHAGGKTESRFSGLPIKSPSGVIVPVKDKVLEKPIEMALEDIKDWKEWFLKSAERAFKAGFDLIEIHAAHGYGLNQWLSPITNKRSDEFGGDISKNARLLLDIVREIKQQFPNILLSVRIPGQDFIENGLKNNDCIYLAQLLQEEGTDIINVSSGIGGWRRPDSRNGEGYLIEEAKLIQSKIDIPVIGVGGIKTGQYIDHILNSHQVSLAAVGRAILKDPKSWKNTQLRSNQHV